MLNLVNEFLTLNHNSLLVLLFVCLIIGYLFGSIPVGYLYCKAHGLNILTFGSGNPGSTNVGRALGKKHGRIVFFFDIFKIVLPVLIIRYIFFRFFTHHINYRRESISSVYKLYNDYIAIYTGLGGIFGHNFPLFLSFKGGKGISCTMGAMLCLSIPYSLFLYFIYFITKKITKYVSVGSITAVSVLLISSIVFSLLNIYPFHYSDNIRYGIILLPGTFIMWLLAILRHSSNIVRLINGTEPKSE